MQKTKKRGKDYKHLPFYTERMFCYNKIKNEVWLLKIIMKPVDMIVSFDREGLLRPLRFRFNQEDGNKIINVDKVITTDKVKQLGNFMLVFKCESVICLC